MCSYYHAYSSYVHVYAAVHVFILLCFLLIKSIKCEAFCIACAFLLFCSCARDQRVVIWHHCTHFCAARGSSIEMSGTKVLTYYNSQINGTKNYKSQVQLSACLFVLPLPNGTRCLNVLLTSAVGSNLSLCFSAATRQSRARDDHNIRRPTGQRLAVLHASLNINSSGARAFSTAIATAATCNSCNSSSS